MGGGLHNKQFFSENNGSPPVYLSGCALWLRTTIIYRGGDVKSRWLRCWRRSALYLYSGLRSFINFILIFCFGSTLLYSVCLRRFISRVVLSELCFSNDRPLFVKITAILVRITCRGNHYQSYHFCVVVQTISNGVLMLHRTDHNLRADRSDSEYCTGLHTSTVFNHIFKCRSEPDTHQPNIVLQTKWKIWAKKKRTNDKKLKPKPVFSLQR